MSSSLKLRSSSSFILERFTEYSYVVLCFGLALWLFSPMLGIFALLFFVQLNVLKEERLDRESHKIFNINNLILLLVVLTITIFASSFDPFEDTNVYIDDYGNLDDTGIFGVKKYGRGFEFVMFLLAYPTFLLSDGSEYWFIFNHALFINILVTFLIAPSFSKRYYPLVLIFVFSVNLYYSEVFYMRQFLSNVFLLMAVSSLNGKRYIPSLLLSIFSHLSNVVFALVTVAFKADQASLNLFNKLMRHKILFNIIAILIVLGAFIAFRIYGSESLIALLTPIINIQGDLLGSEVSDYLENRVTNYDGRLQELEYTFPVMAIVDTIIVGILILFRNFKNANKATLCLVGIYFVYLLAFVFVALTGFNWRVCLIFFSLSGFFYLIGLEIEHKDGQLVMMLLAALKILTFVFWLFKLDNDSYFVFFDGRPLDMTIYDYVVFFLDSMGKSKV
jgi:hypothetical protein